MVENIVHFYDTGTATVLRSKYPGTVLIVTVDNMVVSCKPWVLNEDKKPVICDFMYSHEPFTDMCKLIGTICSKADTSCYFTQAEKSLKLPHSKRDRVYDAILAAWNDILQKD